MGTKERYENVIVTGKHVNPEEALREARLDPSEWELVEYKPYEMGMKNDEGVPTVVKQTSLTFRPRAEHTDFVKEVLQPRSIKLPTRRTASGKPIRGDVTFIWPDTHVPYHDPRAVDIALQVLKEVNPTEVVVLGDLLDCESISNYPKDYKNRVSLQTEIDMAAKLLGLITTNSPNAHSRYFLEGNHEARLSKQLRNLAESRVGEQVVKLADNHDIFGWDRILGLGKLGWNPSIPYVGGRLVLHDIFVCVHGDLLGATPERSECGRYLSSGVSGHTHRIGVYHKRDVHHGLQSWHGVGFLGEVREAYTTFPNWQQGFGVVTWNDDNTKFGMEQVVINEGEAFFRGKLYTGSEEDILS